MSEDNSLDTQIVYAMYDGKARRYHAPFPASNDDVATRMLAAILDDPRHDFFRFSEDYQLFRVGYWDALQGTLNPSIPTPIVGCWVLKAALKKDS